jgi:pilus assembly protein CpaC
MYDNCLARTRTAPTDVAGSASALTSISINSRGTARRGAAASAGAFLVCAALVAGSASPARAQAFESASVVRKISGQSEKLELTTNSSRILTLDKPIPRVQVNNPELLAVTPLSATQVQISAKKAGVTQVNLWDEEGNIHTVDVMVYGDARELTAALQTQFPHSSIRVYRYSESLVLTGFVDRPDHVGPIMRLAEDYAPKVINNINVGGVQQILLKVKVLEVSRTKLRQLGVDWAFSRDAGDFALNSVSDILRFDEIGNFVTNNSDTFAFGIVDGNDSFFGFLEALQEHRVAKILAEPPSRTWSP